MFFCSVFHVLFAMYIMLKNRYAFFLFCFLSIMYMMKKKILKKKVLNRKFYHLQFTMQLFSKTYKGRHIMTMHYLVKGSHLISATIPVRLELKLTSSCYIAIHHHRTTNTSLRMPNFFIASQNSET